MNRLSARTRLGSVVAIAAAAALIPAAGAGADPVTGGKTVLKPDVDTFEGFADMNMSVGARGAARDAVKGVVFPIAGGDVGEGPKGSIEHRGGLSFSSNPGPVVKFTKYSVRIGKNKTKLFARADHSELRFLDLDLSDATIGGSAGSTLKIKGAEATLAKPAAKLMSEVFDFPFRKGIPIGTINIKATLGEA
ncbi:MAG: hypothetical protein ABWZ43_00875 [Solirubrobacterales bacterium]